MTDYDIEIIQLPQGRVAAISTRQVRCGALGRGMFICGEKTPVAFLLQGADGLSCWNAKGARLSEETVERLYPEALSDFRAGLKGTGGRPVLIPFGSELIVWLRHA